jgi:alpha-mannosidase
MKIRNLLFLILLSYSYLSFSQSLENDWPGKYFKGYIRSLTAGKFSYHSPQPDVTTSLLLRSIDSSSYIAWETETIPADLKDPSVNFIWMFGIDQNNNSHTYKLFLNGRYLLTFANPVISDIRPWTVPGIEASSLLFRTTLLDKYDDPMGYAVLKVPSKLLIKGKPQVIKVIGESASSNVWYMTFESAVEEKVDIIQEEAVIMEKGKQYYSVLFNFVHLGKPENATIRIPQIMTKTFRLEPGFNRVQLLLPLSEDTSRYNANIEIGGETKVVVVTVHPVRPWIIYLVQHTHTDIGYTRPQTEILPEHLRYIDYALDFCDQTDYLPDDARFRWTCETSWAVKEYLNTRPKDQVERLKKRIKEGRIEVTGLFLNSSDLSDEASIAWYLQPIKQFRDAGIPVRSAMQDDINGVPWCLIDYLSGCGVNYLSMGQNATRALRPFDRPTTFWWESPSGKRIIVNRPEHYMWGNSLGILTNIETFGIALFSHLQMISDKGYPFDRYSIQFSGYLTDNSPPSTIACELVRQWNEKYKWPKLKLATISEFGKYVEENHAEELPVYRGAWPDWWMDGFGSAALETAYTRGAHEDFISNQSLMAMAMVMGVTIPDGMINKLNDIGEDIAFYDEHTYGAAESISDPLIENSVVQWGEKASYAWSAVKKNRLLREEIFGLIQPFVQKSKLPTITVFNPLNWPRSGMVTVYVDHQVIPKGKTFTIVDEAGNSIPYQRLLEREEGTYWVFNVSFIWPLGTHTFRIQTESSLVKPVEKVKFSGTFENKYYKLIIDQVNGAVKSLVDKDLNTELTDPAAPYSLGQFIYERLGKNRNQLELLKLDDFTRAVWKDIAVSDITRGMLWNSITVRGQMPGCADKDGITCEIRLFNTEKKIELLYSMKKLAVTDPEGVYIAFPFQLLGAKIRYEGQGGVVMAGKEQLEGSSTDWQGIQNFVSVRNADAQVVFVSPEIPLVQLGDINLGKFRRNWQPASEKIYSWVLNNYWTTNFRASQEGELKWSYQITSGKDTANTFATRFGWNERISLLSRVFPGTNDTAAINPKGYTGTAPMMSFLGPALQDLLMISARPSADKKGIIIHLREVDGRHSSIPVTLPVYSSAMSLISSTHAKAAFEVNVLEEIIQPLTGNLEFRPFETKFIKLEF